MGEYLYMNYPPHQAVQITGGFWKSQLEKIAAVTVKDILYKFETNHEEGIMKNYEWVVQGKKGTHIGPPWYDGLICEVIRGISDFIALTPNKELEDKIDGYAEKMCAAQDTEPDGYINTYTTLMCPDQKFGEKGGSIIWQHETYNIGCLVEAGIHYYRATGKTNLLKCAVRAADCLCANMGPAPRKNIVPAHSLAEEAMVKLYRLFRETKELKKQFRDTYGLEIKEDGYLALACFWIDHRGVHHDRASFPHYMGEYAQDHCKIEEQSEAVGHAVRAALLYTGLAAAGIETNKKRYLDAAKRIWNNVEQTKLHISGGIGAVHNEERFGYQYDLPNNAYLETCAGVALAFWAGEMYRAFGSANYMDVLECALYNNVLPGLSIDGTHYFYENPLVSDGTAKRWSWHGCPCCPPMFLKLMGSLPDYIYAYREGEIAVNLYIDSLGSFQIQGETITLEQVGGLPYEGTAQMTVRRKENTPVTLSFRKPAWAADFAVTVGDTVYRDCTEQGYLSIRSAFPDGTTIKVTMELPAVKVEAHPYVAADAGRVAMVRGPLLYCLEETDNKQGTDLTLAQAPLTCEPAKLCGVTTRVICGSDVEGAPFRAVPYFLWGNRETGTMDVWIRQISQRYPRMKEGEECALDYAAHHSGKQVVPSDMAQWEGRLYRPYVEDL